MVGPLVGSKLRYAEHRIALRSALSEFVEASRRARAPSCPGALYKNIVVGHARMSSTYRGSCGRSSRTSASA